MSLAFAPDKNTLKLHKPGMTIGNLTKKAGSTYPAFNAGYIQPLNDFLILQVRRDRVRLGTVLTRSLYSSLPSQRHIVDMSERRARISADDQRSSYGRYNIL